MIFLKEVLFVNKFIFILLAVVTLTATLSVAETGEVDTGTVYQELEGFGASHVWSGTTLVVLGNNNPEIYDVLFEDLGLDIVRLRNNYGYGDEFDYDYIANCKHAITNARDRTGRPLKILISSWSPPAALKSTNNINGNNSATLSKSGGNYVYSDFGTWWADSVEKYASQGMNPDYISIQNEPDFSPNDYEGCRFNPTETSSIAGYNQAFEAVYNELYSRMGSSMPKMLAPETTGFQGASGGSLTSYLSALNLSHVYGYAHHLYNCNDGGQAGCASNPDNYISNMTSFGNSYDDKPILQTEYSDDDHVTSHDACINLAVLMHNSLVKEGAAGYLYWQLTWGTGGLVSVSMDGWTINAIYYAMLHYSRFTDPGWHRVAASADSSSLRISAYLSPDSSKLSVVVINIASNNIDFSLSLGGYSSAVTDVYQTSQSDKAVNIGTFDESKSLALPGRSITTISLGGDLHGTPHPTGTPTATPDPHNAYNTVEAELFVDMNGIMAETCSEGGENIGYIENNDYSAYLINFTNGASQLEVRAASGTSGGIVEVRLDSPSGTLLGSVNIGGTGGWQSWQTYSANVQDVYGLRTVYFVYTGGSGYLFNINWFKFTPGSGETPTPTPDPYTVGDVNQDGSINIVDALLISQEYVGLDPVGFKAPSEAGDTNCDGTVSIVDALLVAQKYVGINPPTWCG